MIPNINKGISDTSLREIIDYHEEKVKEGVATKDFQNFHANGTEEIVSTLSEHVQFFNPKVYKQKFHHIDINFSPEDTISYQDQQLVIKEYLEGMGYDDHLIVQYHHQDKDHDHWHIVTPCSNVEGTRLNIKDDYRLSARLARQLERKYGLKELSAEGEKSVKLQLLNHEKFRFYRALRSGKVDQDLPFFQPAKERLDEPLTNDQLRYIYSSANRVNDYRKLIAYLKDHDLLEESSTAKIYKACKQARNATSRLADYMQHLQDSGYYARIVSKNDTPELKYGMKDESFYIAADKLNKSFTVEALKEHWNTRKQAKQIEETNAKPKKAHPKQKEYLKTSIFKSIKNAGSIDEFERQLNGHHIELIKHSNSGGVYGYSFKNRDITFKGSALDLSFKKINEAIEKNKSKGIIPLDQVIPVSSKRKKGPVRSVTQKAAKDLQSIAEQDAAQAEFEQKLKYERMNLGDKFDDYSI